MLVRAADERTLELGAAADVAVAVDMTTPSCAFLLAAMLLARLDDSAARLDAIEVVCEVSATYPFVSATYPFCGADAAVGAPAVRGTASDDGAHSGGVGGT